MRDRASRGRSMWTNVDLPYVLSQRQFRLEGKEGGCSSPNFKRIRDPPIRLNIKVCPRTPFILSDVSVRDKEPLIKA